MDFKQKIDAIEQETGFSKNTMQRMMGWQGTLYKAYSDNREFKAKERTMEFLQKIGINELWWETGKGEILNKKITRVQESQNEGKSVKPKPNAERIDLEWIDVPIVEVKARAGYLRGYNDPEYMESLPKTMVRKDFERGGNFIAFRIEGDSMDDGTSRSVLDNDVILGREVARHHWASKLFYKKYWFIIVSDNDGIVLKEITDHDVESGVITCHSINNVYEDFKMNLSEVKQIFNFIRIVERKPKI